MAMLVTDSVLSEGLLEQRRERGADKYDEVWEGLYVMHAYPADEHQEIVINLCYALTDIVANTKKGKVRPGVNLASDPTDWKRDYRCPDVVVFLDGSDAVCHDAFWTGGPAMAIEVVSPDDQSRKKIDFYAKVGTRELLFIDRDPWRLELRRHDGSGLPIAAVAQPDGPSIVSESLPLTLRLAPGEERPRIIVTHSESGQEWTV